MLRGIGRMRWFRLLVCCALALVPSLRAVHGESPLASDASPQQAIDYYVNARLQREGISAAPQTDDANLLRRTMLDLVGRPPTATEAKSYLASTEDGKREKLVERLMDSPAFVRQQAAEFDAW